MGLVEKQIEQKSKAFKDYTPRERQLLALKYTPEQLKAIEAGEQAINVQDVVTQGKWRRDPWSLNYIDDLSKVQPLIDKPIRAPDEDIDPDIRPRSDDEIAERFGRHMDRFTQLSEDFEARQDGYETDDTGDLDEKMKELNIREDMRPQERMERLKGLAEFGEGPNAQAYFERFVSNANNFFYSPKGKLNSQSDTLAPEMPKYKDQRLTVENDDEDPHMDRLMKQTGLNKDDIRKIRVKSLVDHRVVNQTRMGKIQSYYFLTIAGNGNGMLGIGEGKAAEPEDGKRQAMMAAIRNMKPIPRYENRTIFGEVEGKVSASVVKLSSRPPGFGNRCQHLIFEMARAAGLSDLSARCDRSRNKMNVVKATYQALMSQRLPDDIARARGRKMVDVRKVYYEGSVH